MTPHLRSLGFGVLATFALATCVTAQADDGLYEAARDPDASFVRLIVPGKSYGSVASAGVSDLENGVSGYINVDPGIVRVAVESAESSFTVEPRSFYSVVLSDDGTPMALPDTLSENPAKADVSFFNLTDLDGVDLFVPRAKANVAQGVAAGSNSTVAVKAPLTLDFEIRSGTDVLATVAGVALERKAGVTIIVTGVAGSYQAFAHENSFVN